ncbi:hybrid sensor histidine kinase/response regulator [Tundrisphaera sp. TA3]|uniref:hybrid sensor histidine kinase/response regulator n=1 Tax=Tundrisphaera sp. TA3 TaxID=3435775 RepID=UPI003EB9C49D
MLAIEAARIGDYVLDLRAGRFEWGDQALAMLRRAPGENATLAEHLGLIHPQDRARVEREIERAAAPDGDGRYRFEFRLIGPDGSPRWIESAGRASFDASGETATHLFGAMIDVTERRLAEEALRRSEGKYRTLLDSIDEGFCTFDMIFDDAGVAIDYRFVEYNPAFERHTGLKDAVGRTIREFLPDQDRHWFEIYGRVATTGEPIRVTRYGEALGRWIEVYAFRVGRPEQGRVAALFSDVTASKEAELALKASEERLRTALAAARMVAWEWTPADRRLRVSETAADVFGLPPGVGLTGIDQGLALVHPDDVAAYEATYRDAIERRGGYHIDYRLIRPSDGRVIWIEERGDTVFDQPGGGVRLFGVAADVTERKRAEAEAARLAEKLRLALDAGGLGTWEWDPATDRMTTSARAAELYGTPPGVPHGREEGRRMIHPDDRERAREAAARAVAEKTDYNIEYRLADRPVWVAARGRGLYDAAGNLVRMHGVVQDVTERKRAEEELRESDRKKDEFIALLAHELRNPLAPIRNGLQALKLAGGDASSGWALGMMDRQLTHMVRLIDDLLDVSRINRHKMELRRVSVTLAEVIASAVETARPMIDAAGHELTVSLPVTPIDLDADLTRLAQVFSNLLTNSAKYTHRGGKIWLGAKPQGDVVSVSVRDTGIGIPEAELPKIFDMFSQVNRSIERTTGGLGIGLALVKGLTEMHGGTVAVVSDGGGTTFTVTLPVLSGHRGRAATEPASPRRAGYRILVVDDSRDGAVSLARLLKMAGHEVRTAFDGQQAVEAAREYRPDVVLMDIGMPVLNGYEATRQIREQPWGESITIIALTGWGQEGDRKRSKEAGCDGHLVKPVDFPDLEKMLAELRT